MVTSILNENRGLSLERIGHQIKICRDISESTRIKGFKIYPVSEKINPDLTIILGIGYLAFEKLCVLAENYPPMPLPEHLDRKDHLQEAVYQFGHLYKQEREWGSSRGLIRGAGGGREVKSNN